jgi:hypothetical protein
MNRKTTLSVALMLSISAALALTADGYFGGDVQPKLFACGTGIYTADLTGWELSGAIPKGEASYDANKNVLTVDVQNVKLKDGTVLDVRIGDDRIGRMDPLKDGSAKAAITPKEKLDDSSRVRVLEDDDRPIVSANLKCDSSQPDQL